MTETLIRFSGEFGRTPFSQGSDGRDDNPFGFSLWLAGGGIRGGTAPCFPPPCPSLSYDQLDGVQDGGAAMDAFSEAIQPGTTAGRKSEIERQLLAYCRLDTFAMVRLWQFFSGRNETALQDC